MSPLSFQHLAAGAVPTVCSDGEEEYENGEDGETRAHEFGEGDEAEDGEPEA